MVQVVTPWTASCSATATTIDWRFTTEDATEADAGGPQSNAALLEPSRYYVGLAKRAETDLGAGDGRERAPRFRQFEETDVERVTQGTSSSNSGFTPNCRLVGRPSVMPAVVLSLNPYNRYRYGE